MYNQCMNYDIFGLLNEMKECKEDPNHIYSQYLGKYNYNKPIKKNEVNNNKYSALSNEKTRKIDWFFSTEEKKQDDSVILQQELEQMKNDEEIQKDKLREQKTKSINKQKFTQRVMKPYATKKRLLDKQAKLDSFIIKSSNKRRKLF